jgi:hypothetical protein
MAIALVAQHSKASAGSGTVTSDAQDTTGANLIVVAVSYFNATVTFSDNKGNTWQEIAPIIAAGDHSVRLYYCASPIVGTGHTFTAGATGGAPSIHILAASGADASPFGGATGTIGFTGARADILDVPEDGWLIVAAATASDDTTTISIASPFTATSTAGTGASIAGAIAYRVQTTKARATPSWTLSPSAHTASVVAMFRDPAAGGGSLPLLGGGLVR